MNILKILLVIGLAFGAYKYLTRTDEPRLMAAAATQSAVSVNGFLALPPIEGHNPAAVVVFAAKDCPQEDAQRADRLADDLKRAGVRVQRTNDISISSNDPGDFGTINAVMNGQLPIVFVRGAAKANPSLSEVLAEYKSGAGT